MAGDHWGFPAVRELINSLSTSSIDKNCPLFPKQRIDSTTQSNCTLGDFEPLWDFLHSETTLFEDALLHDDLGLSAHENATQDESSNGTESAENPKTNDKPQTHHRSMKIERRHRIEDRNNGLEKIGGAIKENKRAGDGRSEHQPTELFGKITRPGIKDKQLQEQHASVMGSEPLRIQFMPTLRPTRFESAHVLTEIQLRGLASASTKKRELISMLFTRFTTEQPLLRGLIYPAEMPPAISQTANGIHVFIDMSNILIGFHDTLKANRGIRKETQIPRKRLSFHNLSLILERGRPVAKRVLVGSDDIESTQEAKAIGYETNILARVQKLKPDPRGKRSRNGASTSSGSDSHANHRQMRRVEQAVDEILHLKMSQSVLDAEEPSIMVLATGDAAPAEYSDGFLKMAERALKKDWKVELVAFKENTSLSYHHRVWTRQWGSSFTIVELDDYAEFLLVE